ncbi:Uncharacterized protein HZ326_25305, partial [Fusarium oxysporum f. sp. albedinis]
MSLISHEETSSRCDVCTLTIPENEVIYKCRVCYGGDFDICSDCYMIGGRCLGDDHELARGKDKEEWVSLLRNSARPVDSHSGRLAQSGRAELRRSIYYEMLLAVGGPVLRDTKLRFPSECNFCTRDNRQPYLAYHRHKRRIVSSLLPAFYLPVYDFFLQDWRRTRLRHLG